MDVEKIVLNGERNVTLTAYTQPVEGEFNHISKRPAVLILPGGGYSMCSDREADPVAFPYLEAGYQAFILRYSVGEDSVWPNPLDDYEQAMALIEERADEWKVLTDKIVVIGFSAGGHLAASAATMSQHRPYAAILLLKEIVPRFMRRQRRMLLQQWMKTPVLALCLQREQITWYR